MIRRLAILAGALLAGVGPTVAQDTPAGDDRYRFVAGRGDERAVTLEAAPSGARLTWGGARREWDTALLGVRVSAGPTDPSVEIAAGGARVRQYLDANGRGLRWLNLTGLRGALKDGGGRGPGPGATVEPGPPRCGPSPTASTCRGGSWSWPRTRTTPR
jgi:hypothetical protein